MAKKKVYTQNAALPLKKKRTAGVKMLNGISDIRRYFYRNEVPIYFISATNFNLLGADEWIKSFKYICYIDCFDKQHPNVFVPREMPHEVFQSIEEINNYLLEHKDVADYIGKRGGNGKALFLMFDEKTEKLARELGLEVAFPPAKLRQYLDSKVTTTRVANNAGVPSVPNTLAKVKNYKDLIKIAKAAGLGADLVVQTPYGDSGHTTFFIASEDDFRKYEDEILKEKEVKIMKRIKCRGAAIEACVTRHGTVVAPLMTELVGFKELTPYRGGWCGNEIFHNTFTPEIREKAREYTEKFGNALREEGYKGYFELDFLIDVENNELYLGELNPRVTGASSITNHAVFALSDCPLFMFHVLEWMDMPYKLNVKQLNKRWTQQENIDGWSQLVIKHTDDTIDVVTSAPQSGIWQMNEDGSIEFSRFDTHRRAVESENEAFFLRITQVGNYRYEGADLGILVSRGRMMTDEFGLTERAKKWIDGIRAQYKSESPNDFHNAYQAPAEIGNFKMM